MPVGGEAGLARIGLWRCFSLDGYAPVDEQSAIKSTGCFSLPTNAGKRFPAPCQMPVRRCFVNPFAGRERFANGGPMERCAITGTAPEMRHSRPGFRGASSGLQIRLAVRFQNDLSSLTSDLKS